MVDHRADDFVKRVAKLFLVYVVLVKAYANRFWVNLHKLGQRVLQAPTHADGAANRKVKVGELFARDVAGGVYRRAAFVYDRVLNVLVIFAYDFAYNRLNFLASGSVSHGDNLNVVLVNRVANLLVRVFGALNLENLKVAQILSCFVKRRALCSSADAGVDSQNAAALDRLLHQKVL